MSNEQDLQKMETDKQKARGNPFKVGDCVECIDSHGARNLKKGKTYEVKGITGDFGQFVSVETNFPGWRHDRFRLCGEKDSQDFFNAGDIVSLRKTSKNYPAQVSHGLRYVLESITRGQLLALKGVPNWIPGHHFEKLDPRTCPLQKGDIVRCIRAHAGNPFLTEGQEYVVSEDSMCGVFPIGDPTLLFIRNRFALITPAPNPNPMTVTPLNPKDPANREILITITKDDSPSLTELSYLLTQELRRLQLMGDDEKIIFQTEAGPTPVSPPAVPSVALGPPAVDISSYCTGFKSGDEVFVVNRRGTVSHKIIEYVKVVYMDNKHREPTTEVLINCGDKNILYAEKMVFSDVHSAMEASMNI